MTRRQKVTARVDAAGVSAKVVQSTATQVVVKVRRVSHTDHDMHRAIHIRLHAQLDELVTDFIRHTGKLPGKATVAQLVTWSHEQTINPMETVD